MIRGGAVRTVHESVPKISAMHARTRGGRHRRARPGELEASRATLLVMREYCEKRLTDMWRYYTVR